MLVSVGFSSGSSVVVTGTVEVVSAGVVLVAVVVVVAVAAEEVVAEAVEEEGENSAVDSTIVGKSSTVVGVESEDVHPARANSTISRHNTIETIRITNLLALFCTSIAHSHPKSNRRFGGIGRFGCGVIKNRGMQMHPPILIRIGN